MARELVNLSDKLESYKEYEELQDKYDVCFNIFQHEITLFSILIKPFLYSNPETSYSTQRLINASRRKDRRERGTTNGLARCQRNV